MADTPDRESPEISDTEDSEDAKLELPSLFRRRRGKQASDDDAAPGTDAEPTPSPAEDGMVAGLALSTAPSTTNETDVSPEIEPAATSAAPAKKAAAKRTRAPRKSAQKATKKATKAPAKKAAKASKVAANPAAEPSIENVVEPPPETAPATEPETRSAADEPTTVLPVVEEQAAEKTWSTPFFGEDRDEDEAGDEESREAVVAGPVGPPPMSPILAAAITGVVTGLVGVLLTYLFGKGCQALRGASSCGGVGLIFLIAVLVGMVLIGQLVLRRLRVPDAMSMSFLGVGLIAIVAMLFFLSVIDTWPMIIVIPLIGAVTFAVAAVVTQGFGEAEQERKEQERPDVDARR